MSSLKQEHKLPTVLVLLHKNVLWAIRKCFDKQHYMKTDINFFRSMSMLFNFIN